MEVSPGLDESALVGMLQTDNNKRKLNGNAGRLDGRVIDKTLAAGGFFSRKTRRRRDFGRSFSWRKRMLTLSRHKATCTVLGSAGNVGHRIESKECLLPVQ